MKYELRPGDCAPNWELWKVVWDSGDSIQRECDFVCNIYGWTPEDAIEESQRIIDWQSQEVIELGD